MSNQTHHSEADEVRFGFTATGSAMHIIDDWSDSRFTKSVCNIKVRDWDEMVEQFSLDDTSADDLLRYDWCGRCEKWLKKMRYFQSMGISAEAPDWVIDALLEHMGYVTEGLAVVIDFNEWKKNRGYI